MTVQEARQRPTMVTVLGWIWITIGAFSVLTSGLVLLFFLVLGGPVLPVREETSEPFWPPGFELVGWVFQYFDVLAIGQFVLAVAVLIAGIELLRLRSWARSFLEVICWLGLLYIVSFATLWAHTWVQTSSQIPADASNAPPVDVFAAFGVVVAVLTALFYALPTGVLIWLLRHRTTWAAVGHRKDSA